MNNTNLNNDLENVGREDFAEASEDKQDNEHQALDIFDIYKAGD